MTRVRASTWQGFDTLIAERCGQYGTLLLGIDKHTSSAYLYAVGHANGTATVIQSLGKVPNVHTAPVYFRSTGVPWATPHSTATDRSLPRKLARSAIRHW